MSATRRQMLLQAQRNLDIADLLAAGGDYAGASRNMEAAKALIFRDTRQASSDQPKVAARLVEGLTRAASRQSRSNIRLCGFYWRQHEARTF